MGAADERASSEYWYNEPGLDPLVPELIVVRDKGVNGCGSSEAPIRALAALAGECFPRGTTISERIKLLITDAVANLEEDRKLDIFWEFGLGPAAGLKVSTRRTKLLERFDMSRSTFQRRGEREIVLATVDAIRAHMAEVRRTRKPLFDGGYVERLRPRSELDTWLGLRVGDHGYDQLRILAARGAGVSRFLHEELKSHKSVIFVDARTQSSLLYSVVRTMERAGFSTSKSDQYGIRSSFKDYLRRISTNETVVVLDGIDAWGSPGDVFDLDEVWLRVISTGSLVEHGRNARSLELASMEFDEALSLVNDRLPAMSPPLAVEIAATFRSRVKLLDQVCSFLLHEQYPVEELMALSREHPRLVADRAALTSDEPSLGELVWLQLSGLLNGNPDQDLLRALDYLTFFGHANTTDVAVCVFLVEGPTYWTEKRQNYWRLKFPVLRTALVTSGLVHAVDGRLWMDEFTRKIVSRARATAFNNTLYQFLRHSLSPDEADLPLWMIRDLVRLGWAPVDVAAYLTTREMTLYRFPPDGLYVEGSEHDGVAREAAPSVEQAVWEWFYLLASELSENPGSHVLASLGLYEAVTAGLSMRDFLHSWETLSDALNDAQALGRHALMELGPQLLSRPELSEVESWRLSMNMHRTLTTSAEVDVWTSTYALVRFIETLNELGLLKDFALELPTGKPLALACKRLITGWSKLDGFLDELRGKHPMPPWIRKRNGHY